jgi:hypothetical protein
MRFEDQMKYITRKRETNEQMGHDHTTRVTMTTSAQGEGQKGKNRKKKKKRDDANEAHSVRQIVRVISLCTTKKSISKQNTELRHKRCGRRNITLPNTDGATYSTTTRHSGGNSQSQPHTPDASRNCEKSCLPTKIHQKIVRS